MRPSFDASIRGGNFMLTKAGITGLSGAATTFSTGGTVTYANNGQAYTKTAFSSAASPTADAVTAALLTLKDKKKCIFVWCLDVAGAAKVVQGKQVLTTDVANGAAAVEFPEIPDTLTPFAYVEIANASGADFSLGTTNWNTASITITTPVDVIILPPAPVTT